MRFFWLSGDNLERGYFEFGRLRAVLFASVVESALLTRYFTSCCNLTQVDSRCVVEQGLGCATYCIDLKLAWGRVNQTQQDALF